MGNRLRVFFIRVLCSRQQPVGCAPLGRTSCGARSRLPRHFVLRWEFITTFVRGRRTGCLIPLTPAAFGCAPLGRTSCGGRSALPQHFRASEEYPKSVVLNSRTRPDGPRAGQARPSGAQPTGCWRERYHLNQKTPHSKGMRGSLFNASFLRSVFPVLLLTGSDAVYAIRRQSAGSSGPGPHLTADQSTFPDPMHSF